jgi:hypothetical protein
MTQWRYLTLLADILLYVVELLQTKHEVKSK